MLDVMRHRFWRAGSRFAFNICSMPILKKFEIEINERLTQLEHTHRP